MKNIDKEVAKAVYIKLNFGEFYEEFRRNLFDEEPLLDMLVRFSMLVSCCASELTGGYEKVNDGEFGYEEFAVEMKTGLLVKVRKYEASGDWQFIVKRKLTPMLDPELLVLASKAEIGVDVSEISQGKVKFDSFTLNPDPWKPVNMKKVKMAL